MPWSYMGLALYIIQKGSALPYRGFLPKHVFRKYIGPLSISEYLFVIAIVKKRTIFSWQIIAN
jgi:hypothetical protein